MNYGSGVLSPANWPYKTWLAMIHTHENTGAPKISNFKEKFAAFSMKTTDPKSLVKINQSLSIMQEYVGNSMNLVRINLWLICSMPFVWCRL